ncbi:hypothetical protein EDD17DRAFT_1504625 [Pisolithus thermaeus]|nr:hypothetical protein EV401DRAFT_1895028 [Pisolithus croceorrhizus]KAI6167524.1 hypothetical protein EDD17DRAFT_1504625 [Pisolithus thermaeus]
MFWPLGIAGKDTVDLNCGANTTCSSAPLLVGSEVDVAQQALDFMTPISCVGDVAIGLVVQADTVAISIQNFSFVLLSFTSADAWVWVHPYAQIAVGILTAAAQLLINRANPDHDMSDLLDTARTVCELLLGGNTMQNINGGMVVVGVEREVVKDVVGEHVGLLGNEKFP